jgi:hypothetical protein
MSRTIKAIMRHMTPKPATRAAEPTPVQWSRSYRTRLQQTVKLVGESQSRPETPSGFVQRKLRLVFASSPLAAAATTDR